MDYVIETHKLTRQFGKKVVVDAIDLQVPRGSIYGFLGPNGAGKTTTIRMLLGLIRPTNGTIRLLGATAMPNRKVLAHIGALVETPSLYPHLTGRENLEIARVLLGASRSQIDRVLQIVNLVYAMNQFVRTYSLGMKQRLGLALALLNEPQLLILDEPTNGLDPAGIHEIRALIQQLPQEYGITVFVSSHLLSEVDQIATHIGIIHHGKLIKQASMQALQGLRDEHVDVGTFDPVAAMRLLHEHGFVAKMDADGRLVVTGSRREAAAQMNRVLVTNASDVYHLSLERRSLEDIFLQLTAETISPFEPEGGK
ncbi:MAG: ABC transporter ATP-binding protein [Armatimonadetes bacterium]|nr:ABC transporter ATP-binding protein [Anaerolineae bacterium]